MRTPSTAWSQGPNRTITRTDLRGRLHGLIQHVLEEEVTGFLDSAKSVRMSSEDSDSGYRNGYSRSRKLTL